MNITFAWWNVGLKPPVASAKEPDIATVLRPWFLFCHLEELLELDLVAFGEVSDSFVRALGRSFLRSGFESISITGKEGRIIFDIAVFYRSDKLELIESKNIVHPHYSGNLRVAVRLEFKVVGSEERFYFYVSHWPSRRSRPELGRDELGYALRADIDTVFKEEGYDAKVILMGDYNDEPFDKPIYDKLVATRDRRVVVEEPFILYNPFWRSLGGIQPYSRNGKLSPCHGTYYYKASSHVTKWFTFDQIIVSSAFMGHTPWHLDEELTTVFSYQDDEYLGGEFFKNFDHLPIYGRVTRYYD
ncbi:endonuclease/exonuclease/phosphatase family protein [Pseudomonas sp. P5_C3]